MMKLLPAVLILLLCLSGCAAPHDAVESPSLTESPHGELPSSAEGLSLSLKPDVISSTKEKMTLTLSSELETRSDIFSIVFDVEVREGDVWYSIPFLAPDGKQMVWTMMGYSVDHANPYSQELFFPALYDFADGEYRIVKTIGGLTLAVPFTIGSPDDG